jgi:phosphoesterase RecJ-like protein
LWKAGKRLSVKQKIFKMIQVFDTIIIHRHERPDPDAIASQCGLKEILKESFPDKQIYAVGSAVARLDFLSNMDDIEDKLYENALVIVVDTANIERISDKRFNNGKKLIKIDHHPNDDFYGNLMWVEDQVSSTSELIVQFYLDFSDDLTMSTEAARLLYAGIVGDTGRFLYPATTPKTLERAAFLMNFSFDASKINQELTSIPMKVAKLFGEVYQDIRVDENGAAYVLLSAKTLEQYQLNDSQTSPVVSLPGQLEEVLSWVIFVEQPDGKYRACLRSKGPIINKIAKCHGGGGHLLASGAIAHDKAEIMEIYRKIQEVVKEWKSEKS